MGEFFTARFRISLAERDLIMRGVFKDTLLTVILHDHAEHAMALDEGVKGVLDDGVLDPSDIDLAIAMSADIP